MKKLLTLAAASAALALGATAAQAETRQERGETRLAEMLEGYEAGESQSCITTFRSNDLQVIPYVGLVYDAGDTIYVARAVRPERLRDTDVPIIERFGSQLCRTDVIRTMDRYSQFVTGALFLEDFVAYNKVDRG
ncbi:hypothetical protein GCM10009127_04100 [Alteraurantiacibacter aestuarii]|uniref:Uncharacterized protein n=1 Tax=Alteraurantiacibacter aestuarii TaxID=650004 RepID=A0A844ZRW2_9SPHN|nr:hypothetical protein [Alteraurantiacibacter aestuarii]MXO88339.1 hypothetical protein [Alteraurantiacibacter aestuarii]